MSDAPIIVLKFGGSVLTDTDRLADITREIVRWRSEGWDVVAVVSALAGRTDALVRRCRDRVRAPDPYTQAGVLALGERESSALLALELETSGVRCASLTPGGVGLRAEGDPLDATPCGVDADGFLGLLQRLGVVVFPGFVALDHDGRTVTLGRGGSDLTALFLAHALGAARCRLLKDVDGLYDADPRTSYEATRYEHATYEQALATDGSIVQHKAVRFAESRELPFELGRLCSHNPTRIGVCSVHDRPRISASSGSGSPVGA